MPAPERFPSAGASRGRLLVIGAGLSGLAAGHSLAVGGANVELWEATDQPGGVVQTARAGEFLFELGPNTVPKSASTLIALASELGLGQALIESRPSAARRFLFLDGRLQALPTTPLELLTTKVLSPGGKLRLLAERLRPFEAPVPGQPEPSFHDLIAARFGPEVAERLAGAFVRGIYAGDARQLGARSAFPRLWSVLERHGSLLGGMAALARERRAGGPRLSREERRRQGALLSFEGGFGRLVDALAESLGERLHLSRPLARLELDGSGGFKATDGAGHSAVFERVALALPGPLQARLLAELDPEGAAALQRIRHQAVHTVHLGFDRAALEASGLQAPDGFGLLVAPGESGPGAPRCLGILFPSRIFSGRAPEGALGTTLIYASETVLGLGQPATQTALEDLARALGRGPLPTPRVAFEKAWPLGIAQAEVGHGERVQQLVAGLEARVPGLALLGGHIGGVSVEDTLASGRRLGRAWLGQGTP